MLLRSALICCSALRRDWHKASVRWQHQFGSNWSKADIPLPRGPRTAQVQFAKGGSDMRDRVRWVLGVAVVATMAFSGGRAHSEDPNAAANPYRVEENWAKLPQGRVWGQAIGVDIDRDGTSVWVYDRCGAKSCEGSNIAPIQKFDASGKLVTSFGGGMINWPHGLFADRDGNVWVTDGRGGNGKGHTVIKFSSDGKVLMTLGKPRSEEHTSELQSHSDLVCRLLLEKKKKNAVEVHYAGTYRADTVSSIDACSPCMCHLY